MAISNDSKNVLRGEIEKLAEQKKPIVQQIQDLKNKRDALVTQRDAIDAMIAKLQADING